MTLVERIVPRVVRGHLFVCALVVCVLLGGGLRLVSPTAAATMAPGAAGEEAPASTACAAS